MGAVTLHAAVWGRLASLAHKAGAVLVVLAVRAIVEISAAATVCLSCRVARPVHTGTRGIWGVFTGFELQAELRKHKFRNSLTPFVVNGLVGMVQ
jgi:vacuolar-type H+-ATPase catalytic subunit A/Vma1